MKNTVCLSLCCLLTFACFVPAFSQKKLMVGVNVNSDYYSGAIHPAIGLTLEAQLTKHSGIESGVFYRTDRFHTPYLMFDSTSPSVYALTISQRFVSVPLFYKYYSKALNVSVGPLLDVYAGWKQVAPGSKVASNGFDSHPTLKVGFLGKVSRTFALSKQVVLEPEVRIGFLRNTNELGAGIGVAAKYRL